MNGEGRQTGSFGDELTNLAMIGLVALFGIALVLRGAGSVTAWVTGTPQPIAKKMGHESEEFAGVALGDEGVALGEPGVRVLSGSTEHHEVVGATAAW